MKTNLVILTLLANISIIVSLALFIVGGILIFSGYDPIRPHVLILIVLIFLLYIIPEHFSNRLVERLGIGDKNSLLNNSFTIFYKYINHCYLRRALERKRRLKQLRLSRMLRAKRARMLQIMMAKQKLRGQIKANNNVRSAEFSK